MTMSPTSFSGLQLRLCGALRHVCEEAHHLLHRPQQPRCAMHAVREPCCPRSLPVACHTGPRVAVHSCGSWLMDISPSCGRESPLHNSRHASSLHPWTGFQLVWLDLPRLHPSAGSEIAGEAAAALAAASMVFKAHKVKRDTKSMIVHAKQLYSLATVYPGSYASASDKSCLGIHKVRVRVEDMATGAGGLLAAVHSAACMCGGHF